MIRFLSAAFFLFGLCATAHAYQTGRDPVTAEATHVVGDVRVDGKALKRSTVLTKNAVITTGPRSYVRLLVKDPQNVIAIGPDSRMEFSLNDAAKEKKVVLDNGICRWQSQEKNDETAMQVHTKSAAFGVRGTDFLAKHDGKSGGSEIVVFDGRVLFRNAADAKDEKLLKDHQWGGVGGKFGRKIAPIKTLDDSTLDSFRAAWKPLE